MFDINEMIKNVFSNIKISYGCTLNTEEVAEKSAVLGKVLETEQGTTVYQSPLGKYMVVVVSTMARNQAAIAKAGGAICMKTEDHDLVIFHEDLVRQLTSDEMSALYLHETGHLKTGELRNELKADGFALVAHPGKVLFSGIAKAVRFAVDTQGLGKAGFAVAFAIGTVVDFPRYVNLLRYWSKTK